MLLSSCVIWRHLEWEDFRAECPGGDEALQRLIWERLDDALDVARLARRRAGVARTPRTRARPASGSTRARSRRCSRATSSSRRRCRRTPSRRSCSRPAASGSGSPRSAGCSLRANPWSDGAGLDYATARGAAITAGMGEFYGRVMPAPPARIREEDFVPLSQLYGRGARVFTDDGREITPPSVAWHESDLAQRIGPRAWYVVAETNERIEAARAAGGTVVDPPSCRSTRRRLTRRTSPPPSRTRSAASASTTQARVSRRRRHLRGGRRRRRRRDRRLRERPRAGARARARRARSRSRQARRREYAQLRLSPRQRRRRDLRDAQRLAVLLDLGADGRRRRRPARASS